MPRRPSSRVRDGSDRSRFRVSYVRALHSFDLLECLAHGRGMPSRAKLAALHAEWYDRGTPLVVTPRPM